MSVFSVWFVSGGEGPPEVDQQTTGRAYNNQKNRTHLQHRQPGVRQPGRVLGHILPRALKRLEQVIRQPRR
jgi:hypothetical protein